MRPRNAIGGFVGPNRWVLACILLVLVGLCRTERAHADVGIKGVRFSSGAESTRVVLDCSGPSVYQVTRRGDPTAS